MVKVDILAFGAHCDDVELGCSGLLLKMRDSGKKIGLIDLTRGEMNSKASPEIIAQEASKAAKILGTSVRKNLDLGDARIEDTHQNRVLVAQTIREYPPVAVLAPYWGDCHNDHRATGWLVRNSSLYCRLKKLNSRFPPHDPRLFLFYLLHDYASPALVVDISKYYPRKLEAIKAYRSQFGKECSTREVRPLGMEDYLSDVETRNRFYGSLINVKYGEAFLISEPLNVEVLLGLFKAK